MDVSRFNSEGKLTLALARNEALFFQHQQIRPEHILLALVALPECLAARLLRELGLDLHVIVREIVVVREVVALSRFGPTRADLPSPVISAVSLRVLEHAHEESRAMCAERTGTEHLLLGLLREDSLAQHVLTNGLGMKTDEVRELVGGRACKYPEEGSQRCK